MSFYPRTCYFCRATRPVDSTWSGRFRPSEAMGRLATVSGTVFASAVVNDLLRVTMQLFHVTIVL